MSEGDRYVTVTPAVPAKKFNVCVMREQHDGEYLIQRISAAMPQTNADALAKSWAVAMQLEIR